MIKNRLTLRTKLLFSAGDLTTSAPLMILAFYQLFFLTDVARLRPGYAAWVIMISKLWDAVNDPLFGIMADRISSRFGRRRILLLLFTLPLGICFFLTWLVPDLGQLGLGIYYTFMFILLDSIFTIVHVAYNSMTPELTDDYDEQSSLNGTRMFFSIFGGLATIITATVIGWIVPDYQSRFRLIGAVIGLAVIFPMVFVLRVTRGTDRTASDGSGNTIAEAARRVGRNRPFWSVMGLYLFSWTAVSVITSMIIYYASYVLEVPDQANYFILTAQTMALAFIPIVVMISRRLDKKHAMMIGNAWLIACLLGLVFSKPSQIGLIYLISGLMGFGIATSYVVPWAMMPDVIAWDRVRTGERREGTYYAVISFFQKLGTGGVLWMVGQVMERSGYVTPSADHPFPRQPIEVLMTIRRFIGIVPTVLLAASGAFAFFYGITREYYAVMGETAALESAQSDQTISAPGGGGT